VFSHKTSNFPRPYGLFCPAALASENIEACIDGDAPVFSKQMGMQDMMLHWRVVLI
jgi:hypothetical protein